MNNIYIESVSVVSPRGKTQRPISLEPQLKASRAEMVTPNDPMSHCQPPKILQQ